MRIDRVKLITEMARQEKSSNRLCAQAGIARATLSGVRGGKSCAPDTAVKIANALGVRLEDILHKEGA